jgi:hypothetical protein
MKLMTSAIAAEGQGLGVGEAELRELGRLTRARELDLAFRRIDRRYGGWGGSRDQLLGEGTVAAAHFNPVEAFRRVEPVEENPTCEFAPAAHHPLVGFAVGEYLAGVAHGALFG